MLIREAVRITREAQLSPDRSFVLLCSFEPLHLATYVQAHLAIVFPSGAPRVVRFGYDELREALARTGDQLRHQPALLLLSWEDLHPALSWRARTPLGPLAASEIATGAADLWSLLQPWLAARHFSDTFAVEPPLTWLPLLDAQPPEAQSPTSLVARAEMSRLFARLGQHGVRVIDGGVRALNYRELLLAGCPLTVDDAERLAARVVDVAFTRRERKKVLALDLDGTMWGGIAGEDESVVVGPDGRGHSFWVFQKFLKRLSGEGVLLALCTKNNPSDVRTRFDTLDMPLRLTDFAAIRCNWQRKSVNLRAIARALRVLPSSVVYIDDNPAELAEIRAALPDVECLRSPGAGEDWLQLMQELQRLFATWSVSDEDRLRRRSMTARQLGETVDPTPGDLSYLVDLKMHLTICPDAFTDRRSLELLNKTNQFNLTGRRLAADEWLSLSATPGGFCFSARLADRHGDFGTIAVAVGVARPDQPVWIENLALSCRAFGRGVEHVLLGEVARLGGGIGLRGQFVGTGKNAPALAFLETLGCTFENAGTWSVASGAVISAAERVIVEAGFERDVAAG